MDQIVVDEAPPSQTPFPPAVGRVRVGKPRLGVEGGLYGPGAEIKSERLLLPGASQAAECDSVARLAPAALVIYLKSGVSPH